MAMAYSAGFGRGAALGVGLGVMLDASYGSGAFFACTYGFSAMVAGVFNRGGRTLFVCVYAVAKRHPPPCWGCWTPATCPGCMRALSPASSSR